MADVDHHKVERFLYDEADLIDSWKLEKWVELFTEDARYIVPATDIDPVTALTVDPRKYLCLVADDIEVLRGRVRRLMNIRAHAESPHSRTRHALHNIRVMEVVDGIVHVRAGFSVFRVRHQQVDTFIGQFVYQLVPVGDSFKIKERRAVLDLEVLSPMSTVSFIL